MTPLKPKTGADKTLPPQSASPGQKTPFPEEIIHLEHIKSKLNAALEAACQTVNRHDQEYKDAKHYLAAYRHEIDPTEIFQHEILLKDVERVGMHAVSTRDRLSKILDSPYFARIDFHADGEENLEIFYIGKFNFSFANELLIYDWRAPVSGMFYDYGLGRGGFDAPIGRISGEILRRRQFKIQKGKMIYALESVMHIQDDILQQELSHTADEKMKTIIATLQKEQNKIVRNTKNGTIIIQGAAGSGKTSVALHRIAYLLYHQKNTLSAKNIVILSPNKVFGDYIANVLPELGEEPLYEISFTDIAKIQLDKTIHFQPEEDPLEIQDPEWQQRMKIKSAPAFLAEMDAYLQKQVAEIFCPTDYNFDHLTVKKEWLQKRYQAYKNSPVLERLKHVAADLFNELAARNYMALDIPKEQALFKHLKSMLVMKNTLALYKDFLKKTKTPFVMPAKNTLEWADVYPFLYFHAHFEGLRQNRLIRHMVIDEMQDYTPVQYAVLNKMFNCDMTIVGDFGQSVHPYKSHTLKDLQALYPQAETVIFSKSYRSSYEIITFAKKIQKEIQLKPVERHGPPPKVIQCQDNGDEITKIKLQLEQFPNSPYTTLGILVKTNAQAETLYHELSGQYPVHLISPESQRFHRGVTISPIRAAKGLEFDQVIIPFANTAIYSAEYDRNLLYIACTRALHTLLLLYCGRQTRFIED